MGCLGVHLVVEIVEHAGQAPLVEVLAVAPGVGAHGRLDGAGVLAEAVALGELGENCPGVIARDHARRVCWLRHLSIDFFENIHAPSSCTQGMRRSVASDVSWPSSMAR